MVSKRWKGFFLFFIVVNFFCSSGCNRMDGGLDSSKSAHRKEAIKIGFSLASLKEERWLRDKDIFVAKAKELGADVIIQTANNDNEEQISQVKYLLDQNIDILVIVPHDSGKASIAVQMAKKAGIKVIAYDRLVKNANVDYYISFDNVKVGEWMTQEVIKVVPSGNYIIINGSDLDNNSHLYNQGYKKALKEAVEKGSIQIIQEVWAEDWMPEEAFRCVDRVLQEGKKIDAVIAANDGLAGSAIEALAERRLAGKVIVAGHDADLSGCQRVAEGTQLLTIYKPIEKLAQEAAAVAIKMAKGEEVKANSEINDGKYTVPYFKIDPVVVKENNLKETVVLDGFHRLEDIYRNVPKAQWQNDDH